MIAQPVCSADPNQEGDRIAKGGEAKHVQGTTLPTKAAQGAIAAQLLAAAQQADDGGDGLTAELAYRRLLDAEPEHPVASARLGRLLLDRNEPFDAFPLLVVALSAAPAEPNRWLDISEAL